MDFAEAQERLAEAIAQVAECERRITEQTIAVDNLVISGEDKIVAVFQFSLAEAALVEWCRQRAEIQVQMEQLRAELS